MLHFFCKGSGHGKAQRCFYLQHRAVGSFSIVVTGLVGQYVCYRVPVVTRMLRMLTYKYHGMSLVQAPLVHHESAVTTGDSTVKSTNLWLVLKSFIRDLKSFISNTCQVDIFFDKPLVYGICMYTVPLLNTSMYMNINALYLLFTTCYLLSDGKCTVHNCLK